MDFILLIIIYLGLQEFTCSVTIGHCPLSVGLWLTSIVLCKAAGTEMLDNFIHLRLMKSLFVMWWSETVLCVAHRGCSTSEAPGILSICFSLNEKKKIFSLLVRSDQKKCNTGAAFVSPSYIASCSECFDIFSVVSWMIVSILRLLNLSTEFRTLTNEMLGIKTFTLQDCFEET